MNNEYGLMSYGDMTNLTYGESAEQLTRVAVPGAAGFVAAAGLTYGVGMVGAKITDKYPAYGSISRVAVDGAIGFVSAAITGTMIEDPEQQVAAAVGVLSGAIAPGLVFWGGKMLMSAMQTDEEKAAEAAALVAKAAAEKAVADAGEADTTSDDA